MSENVQRLSEKFHPWIQTSTPIHTNDVENLIHCIKPKSVTQGIIGKRHQANPCVTPRGRYANKSDVKNSCTHTQTGTCDMGLKGDTNYLQ